MTPIKLATISAFALALSGAAALAQDTMMGDYDADADAMVTQDEFGTAFGGGGAFGRYDADASGTLTEDEFTTGYGEGADFGTYDADASGDLTEDEFTTGAFTGYDTDASGDLSEDEFGVVDTDLGEGGRFEMGEM